MLLCGDSTVGWAAVDFGSEASDSAQETSSEEEEVEVGLDEGETDISEGTILLVVCASSIDAAAE